MCYFNIYFLQIKYLTIPNPHSVFYIYFNFKICSYSIQLCIFFWISHIKNLKLAHILLTCFVSCFIWSCFLSWALAQAQGSSCLTCFVHVYCFIPINVAEMCSQCFSPSGTHQAPIVYRSELSRENLNCLEIFRWLAFPWVPCYSEQAFWRAHYILLPLVLIKENKNRNIIECNVDFETGIV